MSGIGCDREEQAMRFGYWMPIFGGWLRNVQDEGMTIAWPYIRDLAIEIGRAHV